VKENKAKIYIGDVNLVLPTLEPESIQCVVTSPPYYSQRDYGFEEQLGLEKTPKEYIENMTSIFNEVKRVLKPDGTCWIVIGDSYASKNDRAAGLKSGDLIGIPFELAKALREDGWYYRCDIIWNANNKMPESVKNRPTRSHEYVLLLTKNKKYKYNEKSIREPAKWERWGKQTAGKYGNVPSRGTMVQEKSKEELQAKAKDGKNKRSVWNINTKPLAGFYYAAYPPELIRPCILAGTDKHDWVLDPFHGSGTKGHGS